MMRQIHGNDVWSAGWTRSETTSLASNPHPAMIVNRLLSVWKLTSASGRSSDSSIRSRHMRFRFRQTRGRIAQFEASTFR